MNDFYTMPDSPYDMAEGTSGCGYYDCAEDCDNCPHLRDDVDDAESAREAREDR